MNYKIAAVVVTHNRLELLKECIQSLRNQTRKLDEIFIINNSSTDGTLEWLCSQNGLTVITQANSGSAGGQYTGIKTAYEKGYDWIWCFDDDVISTDDALNSMIHFMNKDQVSSIQLLKKSNPIDNTFTQGADYLNIKYFKENKIASSAKNEGYVFTNLFTFEGVLLNSLIIKEVGLPQKDFYCFFDDKEYSLRINKLLPDKKIILVGKVSLENIKHKLSSINNNRIERTFGEVERFSLFMRNMILTYRIHYPEYINMKGFIFLFYNYKWWIIKIVGLCFISTDRITLFRFIKSQIYEKGYCESLEKYLRPINYYTSNLIL